MDASGIHAEFFPREAATDVSSTEWDFVEKPNAPPQRRKPAAGDVMLGVSEWDSVVGAMPTSIVENWHRLSRSGIRGPFFQKLVRLAGREDGWRGAGSRALSGEAIHAYLDFWAAVKNEAVEPAIALTSAGGLQAQWRKNSRQHLDLQFRSARQVFFGLFGGTSVYEGVDSVETIARILASYPGQPLTWSE